MVRGGRGGSQNAPHRPVDLTGIISVAERNDLATLINSITERMHRDMVDIFDSPPVTPIQDDHHGQNPYYWLLLPRHHEKENAVPKAPSTITVQVDDVRTNNKVHHVIEKEQKEQKDQEDSVTSQLGELKKETSAFFRKWQANVLQRIKDVHVSESSNARNNQRGRGRGSRGPSRGRGGYAGRISRGPLTLAAGPLRVPSTHADRELAIRFPPVPNPLWAATPEKRRLLLHISLLILLSLQEYTANSRLLLLNITSSLNLTRKVYQDEEMRVAQGMAQTALDTPADSGTNPKPEETRALRRLRSGHNSSITSTRLAAPLTAAGIGTAHGGLGLTMSSAAGLLGIMAENGMLMGSLFGINSAKPMSKMLETFSREIPDFAFLTLHGDICSEYSEARSLSAENRRLRLIIAMSGCLTNEDDIVKPWRILGSCAEIFVTRWETSVLMNLGSSLETVIKSTAWSSARLEIKRRTIFSSLTESIWPAPLLKISKIMDNPWSVGMVRAEKAGAVLADAIMRHKFQGDRPVSLIGYSLAARAIYACLMVLAERRQFGVVDSVVMMGTPAPSESRVWLTLKSVVCGRLVNVYSEHDYILGFLYRTSNIQFGVAGLQEIQGAHGVENHIVKSLPKGHLSYQHLTGQILRDIGWEDLHQIPSIRKGNASKFGVVR